MSAADVIAYKDVLTDHEAGRGEEQQLHKLVAPAAHPFEAGPFQQQQKLHGCSRHLPIPAHEPGMSPNAILYHNLFEIFQIDLCIVDANQTNNFVFCALKMCDQGS